MCAAAECGPDILGQHPHIGALAAVDSHLRLILIPLHHVEPLDPHLARCPLDLHAFACVLVQRPAIALQRRVHRRHLRDAAGELFQHGVELFMRDRHRPTIEHLALGIGGRGAHTELQSGLVGLVGVEQIRRVLGGLAESQRQQAAGQRIERAGVTRLGGAQQPACLLQGMVGRDAARLVEQQHAIDRVTPAGACHVDLTPWGVRAWRRAPAPPARHRSRPRAGSAGRAQSRARRWCRAGNAAAAPCGSTAV